MSPQQQREAKYGELTLYATTVANTNPLKFGSRMIKKKL